MLSKRTIVILWTALPLILHIVMVAATTITMLRFIDDETFGINRRSVFDEIPESGKRGFSLRNYRLLQSDVTTILSIALVATRSMVTFWCTDIAWKSAMILLEKSSLNIHQIHTVASGQRVPFRKMWGSGPQKCVYAVALALFLPIPAEYAASPILSGSITWTPTSFLISGPPLKQISYFKYNSFAWFDYQTKVRSRHRVVREAGQSIYDLWCQNPDASSTQPPHTIQRRLKTASLAGVPVESRIKNLTVPYMSLTNFNWVTDIASVPEDAINATDPTSPLMTSVIDIDTLRLHPLYTRGWPFTNAVDPRNWMAAIIPTKRWSPEETRLPATNESLGYRFYGPPKPTIVNQTMTVAVFADTAESRENCTRNIYQDYPTFPKDVALHTQKLDDREACIFFATVDVVAGVTECQDCIMGEKSAVTFNSSRVVDPSPDPLVNEALFLTNYAAGEAENLCPKQSWNNPGDYITQSLIHAYAASWSAVIDFTSNPVPVGDGLVSDMQWAVPMLAARVDKTRVYIWLAMQAFVWLSACVFYMARKGCERPMALEDSVLAIFLDTSRLERGLGDEVKLGKRHENVGPLQLKQEGKGWYLKKQQQSSDQEGLMWGRTSYD